MNPIMFFLVALLELYTPANDGKHLRDSDNWAKMSVRIWKDGFMVKTLQH